ncbi:acyl-CoA dehydrogenase family protein [Frigoriflavimonas asaccharolytica]|uniref:Alkylation response protein AidB-like acyl-CoA dehydrogenase n=1 Tax=Frigoriflavimonas asaccharolytica TaxID=2735899 RepID=A0A8J8K9T8_9FLAO|nr:acyl-CoA dehydrogenase family protein [Frigoriflavimonas asaccharolytica]NRS94158.1 alkylation response protein AidB-like acyl-CoA dehydrogenase [Frigoriflavimonas asaccharolytica]
MDENIENNYLNLILFSKNLIAESLMEASQTDSTEEFPKETLRKLKLSRIFSAAFASEMGGENLGLIPGSNVAMLQILKNIGAGNLVMGRVLEGHINAQLLIDQFGTNLQKKNFANDAIAGHLFGVWNTQANDGTTLRENLDENFLLSGAKTFATGSDFVTRPIVTANLEDGSWQMCIVPLDKICTNTDPSWWNPMGMKASRSYKMNFENAVIPQENILGIAGDYYKQPYFSGGSIRFAAVQLGGAETLLNETIKYLRELNRTEDPYQKMRLGEMTILISSGNQWLKSAGEFLDQYMINSSKENSEIFLAHANMMRTAIEKICTKIIVLCQKCVGARGLNKPYHFERIIRDLSTYLRQPAPDVSLSEVGTFALQSDISLDNLWENKI